MRSKRQPRNYRFGWSDLEGRLVMAAPVLDPIATQSVPVNKTLMVPVTATDADGDPLTYTVTSDNGTVTATVRNNHPYLKMTVAGYGDMIFQLFDDITPTAVQNITSLVNAGSYDGLTFHRIISGFMSQGGDPNGTGTGSLISNKFSDEFSPDAIFSGDGQLAMANSGKDTNGSQFFITNGPQRFLDFNHDIFGQLVRGFNVEKAINSASVDSNSKPISPVVISKMSIVTDITDNVLLLKSTGSGSTNFTVTVSDGHGGTSSQTFTANCVADSTNDPAILGPVSNQVTYTNTPVPITLSGFDYENDQMTFDAAVITNPAPATSSAVGNVITVTPAQGYKGTFQLIVGVRQTNATSRGSTTNPWDTQVINITVGDPITIATQAVNIPEAASLSSTTVATFTPLKPKSAASYTASINWGDGRTTAGTVAAKGDGTFTVSGIGSYAKYGVYPVSVSVNDTVENLSISGTTTATVTDAPLAATFVAPARQPGSGVVSGTIAEITDTDPSGVAGSLSATIKWGDGTSSAGTITAANGKFLVSGSKTYTSLGNFSVVVNIASVGGSTASANGSIVVANAAPVISLIAAQSVNEGQALSFNVSATDSDAWQTLSYQFSGTVPSTISINQATGQVSVGSNTVPGTYDLNVVVKDNGVPAQQSQATAHLVVNNIAPTVAFSATPPAVIKYGETLSLAGTVSDFLTSSPISAKVDYGMGAGFVPLSLTSSGGFALSQIYNTAGVFTVKVRGLDKFGAATDKTFSVQALAPPLAVPVGASVARSKTGQVQSITFAISSDLNAAQAANAANWQIISSPGRDKAYGTKDDVLVKVASVSYNAASKSVTIVPAKKFLVGATSLFKIRGMNLKDLSGRLIDGNRDGAAGGDLFANLTKTAIVIA